MGPSSVPSSAADIHRVRGPFPVAFRADLGEDPDGVVRVVAPEEVLAAARVVHLVGRNAVLGVDRGGLVGLGDVAAYAAVVREGLVRVRDLACGVAEVVPEVLPVRVGVVHSCADRREVVREGSAVEGHRAAAEVPASACGHLALVVVLEVRAGGVVPDLVPPYEEALGVAPAEEAGTGYAATGKGRDSATEVPSDSVPAAAASDYLPAKDSPFLTPKKQPLPTIAQFLRFPPEKNKKNSRIKTALRKENGCRRENFNPP